MALTCHECAVMSRADQANVGWTPATCAVPIDRGRRWTSSQCSAGRCSLLPSRWVSRPDSSDALRPSRTGRHRPSRTTSPSRAWTPLRSPVRSRTRAPGRAVHYRLTVEDQPLDVTATVRSVDGGTPRYDVAVEARPIGRALLQQKIGEELDLEQRGAVDCSSDLPPTIDATATCVAGDGAMTIRVTVTDVVDGLPQYDFVEL